MPSSRASFYFAIDLRSLALFRMALGFVLLLDLTLRLNLWQEFYTEKGVWPMAEARNESKGVAGIVSLYALSPAPAWAAVLFAAQALAAIALVVGYRTRTATIVSWVLLVALHARNSLVQNGGDLELRILLFWGAWLPLGSRWSVDARGRSSDAETVCSGASAALLLQVAIIYVTSGLLKTDPVWWMTGGAVSQSLALESYVLPAGRWLREWPELLRIGTYGTQALEIFGPFLAFLPWQRDKLRMAVALSFIAFHAMLGLTLRLGTFPLVGIVGWLPFFPGALWSRETRGECLRAPRAANAAVLALFAIAAFCSLRPWLREWVPTPLRRFASVLRIDQRWDLFAPRPLTRESWYVVVGFFGADGEVDLLTGRPPVWTEPKPLGAIFPNNRWRRYMASLHEKQAPQRARRYVEWVRRNFERNHPGHPPLEQITAYRVMVSAADRTQVTQQEVYVWPEDLKDAPPAPALEEPPGDL